MESVAFIIRPFKNKEVDIFHNNKLLPILEDSGYIYKRADQLPPDHQILERIIHALEDSLLILCDLTDLNPNVMYELGVAHSLTKRVIMICNSKTKLPFDLQDYEILFYNSVNFDYDKFRLRFKEMIASVNSYGLDNPVQKYSKINNLLMDVKVGKERKLIVPSGIIDLLIDKVNSNLKKKAPFVIAISGASGLGKTTFANMLARKIINRSGIKPAIISLDAYMLNRDILIARRTSGYCRDAHDIKKMYLDLKELIYNRKAIEVPFFDHGTGLHTPRTYKIEYQKIIILDGVMSFCEELADFVNFRVFLEATDKWVNLSLRFLVNLEQRGRSIKQSLDTAFREYNYYIKYLHDYRFKTDLLIKVDKNWDMDIEDWDPFYPD